MLLSKQNASNEIGSVLHKEAQKLIQELMSYIDPAIIEHGQFLGKAALLLLLIIVVIFAAGSLLFS